MVQGKLITFFFTAVSTQLYDTSSDSISYGTPSDLYDVFQIYFHSSSQSLSPSHDGIQAALFHQRRMRPRFHHLALVQHDDAIGTDDAA